MQRNAPPVAGNIQWARQLLRRIEGPMKKFEQNKSIMGTKESKRIVKTYNRVARALMEFEALWNEAWLRSVDSVRQGLSATLLVRHPDSHQLLVSFDKDIAKLVKEAKYMQRMGISIPNVAHMVLLQVRFLCLDVLAAVETARSSWLGLTANLQGTKAQSFSKPERAKAQSCSLNGTCCDM